MLSSYSEKRVRQGRVVAGEELGDADFKFEMEEDLPSI
jgi:hypothetical protein